MSALQMRCSGLGRLKIDSSDSIFTRRIPGGPQNSFNGMRARESTAQDGDANRARQHEQHSVRFHGRQPWIDTDAEPDAAP